METQPNNLKRQREDDDLVDSFHQVQFALDNLSGIPWKVVLQHHQLGHYLSMLQSPFACGGSSKNREFKSQLVTVKDEKGDVISCGSVGSLDIPVLKSVAKPSPFGKGTETVYDENVRIALEIPADNLKFPLFDSFITHSSHYMAPKGYCFSAELHKLNIYEKGGFFQDHVDTLHGPGHIATAVVCLPSEFTGGELVVTDGKHEMVFDFAVNSKDHLQWAVMFTDCHHSVKPVTAGTRVTVQYDLYLKSEKQCNDDLLLYLSHKTNIQLPSDPILDSEINTKVLGNIKEKLLQVNLDRGSVGLLLHHRYPTYVKIDQLKGADALLFEYLKNDFIVEVQPIVISNASDYDGTDTELFAYRFSTDDIKKTAKRPRYYLGDESDEDDSDVSEEEDSKKEGNELVIEPKEGGLRTSDDKIEKKEGHKGNEEDSSDLDLFEILKRGRLSTRDDKIEKKEGHKGNEEDNSDLEILKEGRLSTSDDKIEKKDDHKENEESNSDDPNSEADTSDDKSEKQKHKAIDKVEPGTIYCGSNFTFIDILKSIPYIEHTGNEAQRKENYYYAAALIIIRRKKENS